MTDVAVAALVAVEAPAGASQPAVAGVEVGNSCHHDKREVAAAAAAAAVVVVAAAAVDRPQAEDAVAVQPVLDVEPVAAAAENLHISNDATLSLSSSVTHGAGEISYSEHRIFHGD